ncbi:unnamed protein product [Nesidiocoris tenuis]|uniref:Uncharacterized protein n=1 Tax=Nesidiocoris tenuis TaxID=355587 RepID=A0A6H5HU64_9HEMI|nr:unnamed protein product [Nesidiocoris tenuis]
MIRVFRMFMIFRLSRPNPASLLTAGNSSSSTAVRVGNSDKNVSCHFHRSWPEVRLPNNYNSSIKEQNSMMLSSFLVTGVRVKEICPSCTPASSAFGRAGTWTVITEEDLTVESARI